MEIENELSVVCLKYDQVFNKISFFNYKMCLKEMFVCFLYMQEKN